jgi:hypothetical protein
VEVSRYRPSLLAWACVLATLLLVAVAAAIDSSSWLRGVGESAIAVGIPCVTALFVSRKLRESLREKLADAQPLPLGAVDVSDSERDVFLFGAYLFAVFGGLTAILALLFHEGAATEVAVVAGALAGTAVGAVNDSRTIRRWEAGHGRIYTEGRSGIRRKGLYVEDPAWVPLDAS